MLGQFVEDVGGGSDGVGAEIEFQSGPLGGSDEAIGRGFVARDVHITAGQLVLSLDAIGRRHGGVGVGTIVVSGVDDLDVGLCHPGFLGEFLLEEVGHKGEVAVEEPAYESECKHVAAFLHGLWRHAVVSQALLDHVCDGAGHDAVGVDAHLAEIVIAVEVGLFQVDGAEGVGVDDDASLWFGILILCFKCGGVHGHEHVALVAWCIDLALADVDLIARHTGKRALRGADVSGIVWESGDAVAHGSGHGGEDVADQLHAVTGVARETDNDVFQLFYFYFFCHTIVFY